MVRARLPLVLLVLLLIVVGAGAGVVSRVFAAEWPKERQFPLVEPPEPLHLYPPPSAVAEAADGALLVAVYWPVTQKFDDGSVTERPRTLLVRIAPDGSRAFVPPFGELDPAGRFPGTRIDIDDEILPLADGSILFTRFNAIDRRRPDGSIVRFAGTGRYSEGSSGDGGPATAADIGFAHGLSRFPDGSIVFGSDHHRVRRIAADGTITTVAGTGVFGFGGDGGPATAAQLRFPSDVLPTDDGGFLIADRHNGRVRRVSADGVISTVAGIDKSDIFESFGDGGPATAAGLALPQHLGRLPDSSLLIGESQRIRKVSADGRISTIFEVQTVHANRLGDFAGRYGETIEAMEVTREGGIAVIVSGLRLRAIYLAPRQTRRTLVALRDAHASRRRVSVTVNATTRGRLQLQVRRRGKLVEDATRRVRSGRRLIGVGGRFAAAYHDVRVSLRAERGGGYRDHIRLFTSSTLPERLVVPALDVYVRACKRIDSRRIDCEIHNPEDEEDGRSCLNTSAYRLFPSGILFTRPYGPPCHRNPMPFDRSPKWTAPWRAWPPR
jgi:hypothetical protein